jgi:hypothetical protein
MDEKFDPHAEQCPAEYGAEKAAEPLRNSSAGSMHKPGDSPVRQYAAKWIRAWEGIQERVRAEPGLHILGALAVGYILQAIPFRSLLILLIRICFILVRPALLLLGVFKLIEYFRKTE